MAKKLTKKESITPRYVHLSRLYDKDDTLIDEALVIYFKAPKSFTGEDVVEFQCHGGTAVAELVLQTLLDYGARLATPGEFTKRAFLNDKIDLTKAEAIAKMIESKSIDSVKILARQLKGELKDFVEEIRDSLVEILAFVEVNIDYAEEDLPKDLLESIRRKLLKLQERLKMTLESSKKREGLIDGFRVCIIGKPNVGKSSLLNSLLNYDRAIISDIAGTTRDTIEEEVRIGTHLIKIVDTAGIRETGDKIEAIGVQRAKMSIENSDIIIALFDNSRELNDEDIEILELIENLPQDKYVIKVLNKIDLENRFDTSQLGDFIPLSCKKDSQILIDRIRSILDKKSSDETLLLTTKRQALAVEKCYNSLINSYGLIQEGELELFAFEINEAIREISSITSGFERDEILDKMFGNFCLGK